MGSFYIPTLTFYTTYANITSVNNKINMPEILTENQVQSTEALMLPEQYLMVGSFALASSHLLDKRSIDDLPEYRHYKVEGGLQEIRENKSSQEYIDAYYDEATRLVELMLESGAQEQSQDLLSTVSYQLSEGASGPFADSIEQGNLDENRIYRLLGLISRSEQGASSNFSAVVGKSPHELIIDISDKKERVSTQSMLEMAQHDEDVIGGMQVASMYANFLTQGIVGKEKGPEIEENSRLIKKAFEIFGFDADQAQELFDATMQSGNEKIAFLAADRIKAATGLFTELSAESDSVESYKEKIQKLYKTYGIRNFHRYSPQDLERQLTDDFTPDEVVITAVEDPGSALSKPSNSSRGLEYNNPVYFEASDGLGIAKALITAQKLAKKPLDKIMIRAHGSPNGFGLSEGKYGTIRTEDIVHRGDTDGWEKQVVERGIVSIDAELVFESCSLGAGGFPQSLYERTGLEALTASANITGSAIEGSPGVLRVNGKVKFGTNSLPYGESREVEGMTDSVVINRKI
jgi:hypothetical protein